MKLLISLLLTVLCVHCTPLYGDDNVQYTETRTSYRTGYNATLNVNAGIAIGYKNGTAVLESKNNIGPDFSAYNETFERTYGRPADTTPQPPNSGPKICGENCILVPPSNQMSMQNRPWVISNNPSKLNNQWDMQNGQQWVMANNPSGQRYIQSGIPNKQLILVNNPGGWSNYPTYGTPNGVPIGTPSYMSQQHPSYGTNIPGGWSNQPTYGTLNGAPNGTPNEMLQQNPSYGTNNPGGWSNQPTYGTLNGAQNGTPNEMLQQNPSYGTNNPGGWSNQPIYGTPNSAPNGTPNEMLQQNPSYAQRSTYMR